MQVNEIKRKPQNISEDRPLFLAPSGPERAERNISYNREVRVHGVKALNKRNAVVPIWSLSLISVTSEKNALPSTQGEQQHHYR